MFNEDEQATADRINATWQRRVNEVLSRGMDPRDRDRQLSRIAQGLSAQLDALSAKSDARVKAEGQAAWERAFGLPKYADASTIMAARDAVDRCRDIGPAEARELLDQAMSMGDSTLAAAIGARAFASAASDPLKSRPWADVVDQYSAGSPFKQAAISVLAGQVADGADRLARLQDGARRRLMLPDELRGKDINRLAAEPLSTEVSDE